MMWFITDFADQAVIQPVLALVAAGLWFGGWYSGARIWLLCAGGTLASVGVAKVLVFAFGPFAVLPDLDSPSGHTASAGAVFGGIAILLLPPNLRPHLGSAIAVLLTACSGAIRVALEVHTVPDVLAGALIGLAGALVLTRFPDQPPSPFHRGYLLIPAGLAAVALHGHRLTAEPMLRAVGAALRAL